MIDIQSRRERMNRGMWAVVDSGVWIVAIFLAAWLRYDLDALRALSAPLLMLTVATIALQLVAGTIVGPYAVGHERGSFEETADVSKTVAVATVMPMFLVFAAHLGPIPRSVPF